MRFFENGAELYPVLKRLISDAKREILISTYAFHNDRVGREFAVLLAAAAARGIRVRVLLDGLGSWGDQEELLKFLRAGGAEARVFRSGRYLWRRPFSFLYRNHARLFLFDRKKLGLGGMGIGRIYEKRSDIFWLGDCDEESSLPQLFEGWWSLADRSGRLPGAVLGSLPVSGDITALVSGPYLREARIYGWLLSRISSARKRIVIASPWFLPPARLLREIAAARRRGVEIKIITPLSTDRERYDGFRALPLSMLLSIGVEWYGIREYFHQKFFLIDEDWWLGSANCDILSLRRNYELGLVGHGGPVLGRLENNLDILVSGKRVKKHPVPRFFRSLWRALYGFLEFWFTASPSWLPQRHRESSISEARP